MDYSYEVLFSFGWDVFFSGQFLTASYGVKKYFSGHIGKISYRICILKGMNEDRYELRCRNDLLLDRCFIDVFVFIDFVGA